MKKKARKIVVCVMVVMSIFAVCSTAFAAGETLNHRGTAKYSYYTTGSVEQKYDNNLVLNSHTKSPTTATVEVSAVVKQGSNWIIVSTNKPSFSYPCTVKIPDTTSIRDVHLLLKNTGSYYGISVTTSGNWTLNK